MAFPQVASTNNGYNDSAGTNHTCNLPSGIQAGDLLLLFFGWYTGTSASLSGWSNLGIDNNGTYCYQIVFYKIATGSEGATVSVTTGSSTKSSHVSYIITGHDAATTPEKGTSTNGTNSSPDPPSLSPSWGSADTLWISTETNRNDSFTSYPSSHPDNQVRGGNTSTSSATETAICTDEDAASSNNPGTYTLSTSRYWVAQTFAIRPAQGPAISDMEDEVIEPIGGGNYETDNVITGTTFGASQGAGYVELGNNASYTSCTVKTTQTIDSWSDTSIQFDAVKGSLSEGTVWVYVTNNSAQTNATGYEVYLGWPDPTITDCEDEKIDPGENDILLDGTSFEHSQGTGKLEIVNNITYGSGTIFEEQDIDSWSNTQIQFDSVQGSLPDGTHYLFVTTDTGKRNSVGYAVYMGATPLDDYTTILEALNPDEHWPFQNNFTDTINGNDFDDSTTGSPDFVTDPVLCRGDTYSLRINAATENCSAPNNADMNMNTHTRRYFGGWIQVDSYQKNLVVLYEEGAGINNLCFLLGFGNIMLAQVMDSDDDSVQCYSDEKIYPNRPYHVMLKFEASGYDAEVKLFVDGIEQSRTEGNPWTASDFDQHLGDICMGKTAETGNDLETLNIGGTIIEFFAPITCYYSHWANWDDDSLTPTEIREELFEKGMTPDDEISSDTQANMQTDLDTYADTERPNWSCALMINRVTGGGDLELIADNITFSPLCSVDLWWDGLGSETLTWVLSNGSTIDTNKIATPRGGSVNIVKEISVTITTRDASTLAIIEGARVLITVESGGPEPYQESISITRSGSTATVTHSSHGLRTGQVVLISGANQVEYNGIHTITVTTSDAYTYAVSGTPDTPATGTITATLVILTGVSDGSGEVTGSYRYISSQPISGLARKSSSAVYYKTSNFAGTIGSTDFDGTIFLIKDE